MNLADIVHLIRLHLDLRSWSFCLINRVWFRELVPLIWADCTAGDLMNVQHPERRQMYADSVTVLRQPGTSNIALDPYDFPRLPRLVSLHLELWEEHDVRMLGGYLSLRRGLKDLSLDGEVPVDPQLFTQIHAHLPLLEGLEINVADRLVDQAVDADILSRFLRLYPGIRKVVLNETLSDLLSEETLKWLLSRNLWSLGYLSYIYSDEVDNMISSDITFSGLHSLKCSMETSALDRFTPHWSRLTTLWLSTWDAQPDLSTFPALTNLEDFTLVLLEPMPTIGMPLLMSLQRLDKLERVKMEHIRDRPFDDFMAIARLPFLTHDDMSRYLSAFPGLRLWDLGDLSKERRELKGWLSVTTDHGRDGVVPYVRDLFENQCPGLWRRRAGGDWCREIPEDALDAMNYDSFLEHGARAD